MEKIFIEILTMKEKIKNYLDVILFTLLFFVIIAAEYLEPSTRNPIGIIIILISLMLNLLVSPFVKMFRNKYVLDNITDKVVVNAAMASVNFFSTIKDGEKISENDVAVSITYLDNIKTQHRKTRLTLLLSIITVFGLSKSFNQNHLAVLALIPLVFLIIVVAKEIILERRILSGEFGSNHCEAKDLLMFIISNSDEIDFTDSSGKLREGLIPKKVEKNEIVETIFNGASI